MEAPRIDKFLWAVRLFKTRSLAAEACKLDKVKVNGKPAKPAYTLKLGDVLLVKMVPIWREYTVIEFLKNRVSAALVSKHITETTSIQDLEKLEEYKLVQRDQFMFTPSKGRPTKKDRRSIIRFKEKE